MLTPGKEHCCNSWHWTSGNRLGNRHRSSLFTHGPVAYLEITEASCWFQTTCNYHKFNSTAAYSLHVLNLVCVIFITF